ncbi:efflux RND transporter permease subunit [Synechococcus sp. PCC 7336]|uniref:efflux RND transporter permease subunit n=1 Tax=Synechococcus sp. PCC 7336 TaxID=195250 RepID=UPI00034C0B7B|nr:efflux RND transporter permease subunit [Synechococcus sp. PCC 7336]
MWDLFYRNRRLLVLVIAVIWLWGLVGFQALPRMEDPNLTQRNAAIVTLFPGANSERVESLVTKPIEDELVEIEELKTIASISQPGISIIKIELSDTIRAPDTGEIWFQVRDRLNEVRANLPVAALEPEFQDLHIAANTAIVALTWDLEVPPSYGILRRSAESLADQLRNLPGTETVELFGAPEEEIVVEVDPDKLSAIGLITSELSQQIAESDAKLAAGQRYGSESDLPIAIDTELDSLERIGRIPIRTGNTGQFAHLSDIANIERSIVDPPAESALVRDRASIVVAARINSEERIDRWSQIVRQTLSTFEQQLPQGIIASVIFDQKPYVDERLRGLIQNLLFAAVLVSGMTLFMMGWQSSLAISLALPLSIMMAFGCMWFLHIPLQQVSMTGLIVALGMLIDNAIIMVDEVTHRLKDGQAPSPAIESSIRKLGIPLLGSTITTILAFLPMIVMRGSTGEFVSTLSISVILAVTSSLILAMTVIPSFAAHIAVKWKTNTNPSNWWNSGYFHPQLARAYRWTLDYLFSRPKLGILLALAIPFAGFVVSPTLPLQFFPPADRDQFHIEVELAPQASLAQTQTTVTEVSQLLRQHSRVKDVNWFIGTAAPTVYYNLVANVRQNQSNYAQGIVRLDSFRNSSSFIRQLQAELDRAFPQAQILARQLDQGPPFNAPIEMRLYGPDREVLKELGDRIRSELAQLPDIIHTRASLSEAVPKLALQVDEEKIQLLGLSNSDLARQLNASLDGFIGGSILEATEELPVRVRISKGDRSDLNSISSLNVLPDSISADGSRDAIPISALTNLELKPELASIERRNQQRVNTIQAFIPAGALPAEALSSVRQRLEAIDFSLPTGYSYDFGGEVAERQFAISSLFASLGILAVLMAVTLVLSLNSFRLAAIIGVVAVGSAGLGFASLWLYGYPLGFMAIIGMMGLIGVAINDSIVVLNAISKDPVASQGSARAIADVVMQSSRHVLATTVTTIAGFVPLILQGGGFWPPLAIVICSGLVGATVLALYFCPSAYRLLMSSDARKRRVKSDGPSCDLPAFVLVLEDARGERIIPLNNTTYTIGRSPKCDIRPLGQYISREHAKLVSFSYESEHGYGFTIVDGCSPSGPSANGTFVNAVPISSHRLSLDDVIHFGPKVKARFKSIEKLDELLQTNLG